jgi:hypothetical protein
MSSEPSRKRPKTLLPATPLAALAGLTAWFRKVGATGWDALEFKASNVSGGGGLGAFSRQGYPAHSDMAFLPHRAILTADKALATPLGVACRQVCPQCTDEFVLCLWMAEGRSSADPLHPFHAYLASLPAELPSPVVWDKDTQALLKGTNLGAACDAHRALVHTTYAAHLAAVRLARPDILDPACDIDAVDWAHQMYVSRRFPAHLWPSPTPAPPSTTATATNNPNTSANTDTSNTSATTDTSTPHPRPPKHSELTASLGLMLPGFDLLNHSQEANIVRCAFSGRNLHSMMPLVPTPLLRLKRCHA